MAANCTNKADILCAQGFCGLVVISVISVAAHVLGDRADLYQSPYMFPLGHEERGLSEFLRQGPFLTPAFGGFFLYGGRKITERLVVQRAEVKLPVLITGIAVLAGMTAFEFGKNSLFPRVTIWESHIITILFSVLVATVTACFVFRKQKILYEQAVMEITQRRKTEEALRKHQEQLSTMAIELSLAEERERRRIASELHDQVGQTLLLSRIKLGMLESSPQPEKRDNPVDEIRRLLDQSIQEIRSLTFQLAPPLLACAGLEATLEWLVRQMEKDYPLRVEFRNDGQPKPLTDEMRFTIYQAVRELLINTVKHAEVKEARLHIARDNERIKVTVEDHGVGFNVGSVGQAGPLNGFGLFNIRQKIEYLGGELMVESQPGSGTRAIITAPLNNPGSEKTGGNHGH